mgnify:CR=1 FL=1
MIDQDEDRADAFFHALADRTRRDIVVRSLQEPRSVTELSRAYSMSFAAVQKHVAVLEQAGLVTKERSGRTQLVRGNPETVRRAAALLEQYEVLWIERAERMRDILTTDRTTDNRKDQP